MIRAILGPRWPALTIEFGLMPWHVKRMSARELRFYLDAADQLDRARRDEAAAARRNTRRR